MNKLGILLVGSNILCAICFMISAIINLTNDEIVAGTLNIICIMCWTVCAVFNYGTYIKKEKNK